MTEGKIYRFLIADDSRVSRARLREYVERMGHDVIAEAVDGVEAVAKFDECLPDFVTMDIEMPNLNGIEASRQILKAHPEAKIILVTSVVDKKNTLDALRFGVRNVLQKPLEFETFANEINSNI